MINKLFSQREQDMIDALLEESNEIGNEHLLNCLFGSQRSLFKRVANFSCFDGEKVYRAIAQRPYSWTVSCSEILAELIGAQINQEIDGNQVLIDAPPVGLEVQFNVDVYFENEDLFRELGSVSPVVQTLATRQFDDFVKQVRIFVDANLRPAVKNLPIVDLVEEAVRRCGE